MAFAKIYSAQPQVLHAGKVTIEADTQKGLHQFSVVGLPDKAVEESRDRVSAAIKNSGWKPPKQQNQKITIALAPADIKKEGPLFDLPIALAYLVAAKELTFDPEGKLFVGELSLDGTVRPVKGILNIAKTAQKIGARELYVPKENAEEAALIHGITVFPVESLLSLVHHLKIGTDHIQLSPQDKTHISKNATQLDDAYLRVRGQETAKRGLLIAAAGGHNIALWGPPGTGKTLLAKAFRSLLPHLEMDEAIEVTAIHSLVGTLDTPLITDPPFRSPHHTSSYVSIIGGGAIPKPGEVTLAHRGVLFLDEFPEFDKRVLESLRQPLEDGVVHVSRAKGSEKFPARFLLVAAMNPCPCGYYGDPKKSCVCAQSAILRYQRKISGPIVDRVDLWIEVPRIEHQELAPSKEPVDMRVLRGVVEEVAAAREVQRKRFKNKPGVSLNSHMGLKEIDEYISLEPKLLTMLTEHAKLLDLSPRAFHRILKLSRTIADIEKSDAITEDHILEALQYRPKRLFA